MFSKKFLADCAKAEWQNSSADFQVEKIITDSRIDGNNALFVPLIGENFNGHDFIETAIARHCTAFVVQKNINIGRHNLSCRFSPSKIR